MYCVLLKQGGGPLARRLQDRPSSFRMVPTDVHIVVKNFRTLECSRAVVTTRDADATSTDGEAQVRWRQRIAQEFAESEPGWRAQDIEISMEPSNALEEGSARISDPSVTKVDIHVIYGNSRTGESGAATVSTNNLDLDVIDDSQVVRDLWCLDTRKRFAEREGWILAETTILVDDDSVDSARVLFESAALHANQMAQGRFVQDKLVFDFIAATVVNIRAGNDTIALEKLVQESPGMLKLIADGWEVISSFTELFRLQRAAPHRRILMDELEPSIDDARARRLVRLCLAAANQMTDAEAARIVGRALDAAVHTAPPASRQLVRQISSPPEDQPELLTTEALKMATVRLSGTSFQRLAKRVAEVIAASSGGAEHPAADAEWAVVTEELQAFEARGWRVSDAAGLLRVGVREADVLCEATDPKSAVLCHLMLRLVNEQALPAQRAPPVRLAPQARREELAELSATIATLSARLAELSADAVRELEAEVEAPPRLTSQEQLELAMALSLSESLRVASAAADEAAAPARAALAGECPICMCGDGEAFRPSACAHEMHRSCAVELLRAALRSARSEVLPSGVRCPCRTTLGCAEFISIVDCASLVREVVANEHAASIEEDEEESRSLSPEEFESLTRFAVEAAVPENEKLFCPACERMILLDTAGQVPTGTVQCPHCSNSWSPAAASGEDAATTSFLDATSKRCPTCGVRSTHYHGHDCHHIGYGSGGCLTCKQHWCYVCLLKHGTPQGDGTPTAFRSMGESRNPACTHGSSFCERDGIAEHLVQAPYPHDSRCGCPICPTCRPGSPCEQCPGNCVVCRSLVPPGPSELAA